MTMNRNTFDFTDLSDIPNEVKSELSKKGFVKDRICNLLKSSLSVRPDGLNIDEILVAYYRQHKEKVTRDTMYVHLNRLKVLGRVKKVRNKFIYVEGDS